MFFYAHFAVLELCFKCRIRLVARLKQKDKSIYQRRHVSPISRVPHNLRKGSHQMTQGEVINILVVDDNEDLLDTLAVILKHHGFNVETAINGTTAVDTFRHGVFDVTLMDVTMPEMNGIEAFRHIREIDPDALVILMTASFEEDITVVALQEGVHCVVPKPFRIDQTIEVIKKAKSSSPVILVDTRTEMVETVHQEDEAVTNV